MNREDLRLRAAPAIAFLLLLAVTSSARADLWFEDRGTSTESGKSTPFVKQTWLKQLKMRSESSSARMPSAAILIGNEEGMFSCVVKMKRCAKMPYQNGATHIFASITPEVETLSVTLRRTGARRKVANFDCDEYRVARVMQTKGDAYSKPVRSQTDETNCYSPKFRDLLPAEFIAEYRRSIGASTDSASVKKALLQELSLGVAIKHQITTKTVPSSTPDFTLTSELAQVNTRAIDDKVFRIPAGFRVDDAGAVMEGTKKMQEGFNRAGTKALRATIPPEQIQRLKMMRDSGQIPPEQRQQVDALIRQLESAP